MKPSCAIWLSTNGFARWMMPSGVVPNRECG
jgi:hypothetical protein